MRKNNTVLCEFVCYSSKKAKEFEGMIHDIISNPDLAGDLVESGITDIIDEKLALQREAIIAS